MEARWWRLGGVMVAEAGMEARWWCLVLARSRTRITLPVLTSRIGLIVRALVTPPYP
jgi:hypothetical protein